MTAIFRTKMLGLWHVFCSKCDLEEQYADSFEASAAYEAHEEMHTMTDDLNRYFGLVGASIAWKLSAHFGQLSLS